MAIQTFSRRRLITSAALLFSGVALFAFVRSQDEPPPASWVRDELWGDNLLAYVVWDGVPRAVLKGSLLMACEHTITESRPESMQARSENEALV